MSVEEIRACPLRSRIDPRLRRFSAGATAVVLVGALLLMPVVPPLGMFLLASEVAVSAFTGFINFQWSIWARIYARFIWPRIGAPSALEDARPARFAKIIGFVLTAGALVFFLVGMDVVGYTLVAITCLAAALNASTGLCLGCKAYQLVRRS